MKSDWNDDDPRWGLGGRPEQKKSSPPAPPLAVFIIMALIVTAILGPFIIKLWLWALG